MCTFTCNNRESCTKYAEFILTLYKFCRKCILSNEHWQNGKSSIVLTTCKVIFDCITTNLNFAFFCFLAARDQSSDQGITHCLLYAMAGVFNNFKKNKGPNMIGQRANEDLWTRTGTFVNKPQRGWLHGEEKVKAGGICYGVRVSL